MTAFAFRSLTLRLLNALDRYAGFRDHGATGTAAIEWAEIERLKARLLTDGAEPPKGESVIYPKGYNHRRKCSRTHPVTFPCDDGVPMSANPSERGMSNLATSMARAMTDPDYEPSCDHGREYEKRGLCTHPDHAPKRSLDAPSEAAHREPDSGKPYEWAEDCPDCIEREAAHREPDLDAAMRFAEARLADPFAGRDNLTVPRSLLVTLVEHIEREAAHPSGAGSGLREALAALVEAVKNAYVLPLIEDAKRQRATVGGTLIENDAPDIDTPDSALLAAMTTARAALAAPTVSRDGEVAADLARLDEAIAQPRHSAPEDNTEDWIELGLSTATRLRARLAIEREAAHPSGAGSGLREALERIDDTIGDGGRFNGSLAMLVRIRSIAREALAATPAVSRDGAVAAIAAALNDADNRITETTFEAPSLRQKRLAAALYDAGLRVAPSASGDSLDVALDDLRLRVRGIGNYAYTQAVLAQIDAVAELALAARLRSTGTMEPAPRPEPTGATPESEG